MQKPSIYLFCPAYNDEGNIEGVVSSAVKVLEEISSDYLVTVVEDGSPDRTGEVADELAKRYLKVKVIHHPVNRGYGEALKTGFTNPERVKYDLVAYTDGDGQFDIGELRKAIPLIGEYEVVMGYRMNRADSLRRKIQSMVYNFLMKLLFGLPFRDTNCSFKVFKREVIDDIRIEFPTIFLDGELTIKMKISGRRIAEIGVHHYPRMSGAASGSRWNLVWETMKDMFRFYLRYMSGGLKRNLTQRKRVKVDQQPIEVNDGGRSKR